jgi:streptogramin lyase
VTVPAPAGDDVFAVATYQSTNGTGPMLASTSIAAASGTTGATVALDLGGVPAALSFSPARLPLVNDGTVQRVPVVVNVSDASGATIVGATAYQSPVDLQIQNDAAGALALSTTSVASPGTVVTVTYNSLKTLSDAQIVAHDNGMAPATLIAAPLQVNPMPLTILDDANAASVSLAEAGFTGTFTAALANAADGVLTIASGTLGSGSAVATIVPKVSFDVTTLNVNDGSLTLGVPVQIVPDHNAYTAIGAQHTLQSPTNLVHAANGLLWTGDSGTGNLVSFNPSTGAYTSYNVDPSLSGPNGIALDASGNIWFADGPQIGVFNPATQAVTTYSTGLQANAYATAIIAGPSGTMWFYDQGNSSSNLNAQTTAFGSIATSTGAIVEHPTANLAGPVSPSLLSTVTSGMSMALASDGSVWFADTSNDAIGHLNTATGGIAETALGAPPYPQQAPQEVTITSDGKVWFSAYGPTSGTGTIGYVNPATNGVTYYPVVSSPGQASAMFVGSDGNIWFVDTPMQGTFYSDQELVGVVNPTTGAVYLYPNAIVPAFARTASIVDENGTFWTLDSAFGQIGKVSFK